MFLVLVRFWATAAVAAAMATFAAPALGAARPYDFDGDGRQELASHIEPFSTGGHGNGAAVIVRTGPDGLDRSSSQVISYGSPGIQRFGGRGHDFGGGIASGDFDGDGFADLALTGSPNIVIVYGSREGLDPRTSQSWTEPSTRFHDPAAGDVDRDGYADLVVNAQEADFDFEQDVALIRGTRNGLAASRHLTFRTSGRLSIANLDRSGRREVVVAGQDSVGVCRMRSAGRLCAIRPSRLSASDEPPDLATGDVTGTPDREIVVGLGSQARRGVAGAVHVYRLARKGPRFAFAIRQSTRGVPGREQEGDDFGASVAVGRVGPDRKEDIAIGAPGEDRSEGRVTLVRGARKRVARRGNRTFTVGRTFGFAEDVALLDHDGDRRPDLDIGASSLVFNYPATRRGLPRRPDRRVTPDSAGWPPYAEGKFGLSLGKR